MWSSAFLSNKFTGKTQNNSTLSENCKFTLDTPISKLYAVVEEFGKFRREKLTAKVRIDPEFYRFAFHRAKAYLQMLLKLLNVINPVVVVRTSLINYISSGSNARIERLKFIY